MHRARVLKHNKKTTGFFDSTGCLRYSRLSYCGALSPPYWLMTKKIAIQNSRTNFRVGRTGSRLTLRGCTSWPKTFGSYLWAGFCLRSTRTSSWAKTTKNLNFQISRGFLCSSHVVSGLDSTTGVSPNQSVITDYLVTCKKSQSRTTIKKRSKLSVKRALGASRLDSIHCHRVDARRRLPSTRLANDHA